MKTLTKIQATLAGLPKVLKSDNYDLKILAFETGSGMDLKSRIQRLQLLESLGFEDDAYIRNEDDEFRSEDEYESCFSLEKGVNETNTFAELNQLTDGISLRQLLDGFDLNGVLHLIIKDSYLDGRYIDWSQFFSEGTYEELNVSELQETLDASLGRYYLQADGSFALSD